MKVFGFYFLRWSSVWIWTLSAQKPAKFQWNLVEFHQISSNFLKNQIFTLKFQEFDKSYWSEILYGYWYWYSLLEKNKIIWKFQFFSTLERNFTKFDEISWNFNFLLFFPAKKTNINTRAKFQISSFCQTPEIWR